MHRYVLTTAQINLLITAYFVYDCRLKKPRLTVFARWRQCARLAKHTLFLGLSHSKQQLGGSGRFFARLMPQSPNMLNCNAAFPQDLHLGLGPNRSLDSPAPPPQTTSPSSRPFLQNSRSLPMDGTDRQTEGTGRFVRSMCNY